MTLIIIGVFYPIIIPAFRIIAGGRTDCKWHMVISVITNKIVHTFAVGTASMDYVFVSFITMNYSSGLAFVLKK